MDGFWDAWHEAGAANAAYAESLAPWVQVWIGVMTGVIRSSLFFILWRWEAFWVLLVGALTPVAATLLRMAMGEAYPPGFNHLILWTPLAVYILIRWWRYWPGGECFRPPPEDGGEAGLERLYVNIRDSRIFRIAFGIWLTLVALILLASLGFDAVTAIRQFA